MKKVAMVIVLLVVAVLIVSLAPDSAPSLKSTIRHGEVYVLQPDEVIVGDVFVCEESGGAAASVNGCLVAYEPSYAVYPRILDFSTVTVTPAGSACLVYQIADEEDYQEILNTDFPSDLLFKVDGEPPYTELQTYLANFMFTVESAKEDTL